LLDATPAVRNPLFRVPHNPGSAYIFQADGPQSAALLAAVRERYDLVVLDTPPVLPVADALVLAQQADATLMVVRWEKTARPAVQDAVRARLCESRARIMGTVMTRVDLRRAAGAPGRMSYAFSHYDTYHTVHARSVFFAKMTVPTPAGIFRTG
jgi:cellulose biosynthesis protein BcsQ